MTEVVLDGVSKHYAEMVAVDRVSLRIPAGQFVALLGPSGCGKTTTLRMVAGFVDATQGRITIGGRDVTQLPPWRRNTGLVFQNYALFPHRTVAQNVGFGLQMRGIPRAEAAARVATALQRVKLQELADRLPKQLSGGQQQRVALARALVIEPDVLLLDEPLSNLDARLRLEMRTEIRALQRALELTAIFVTHDQEEAFAIADIVAVMHRGQVEQVGTPAEIYETPSTRFVAEFTGVHNLLPGRVTAPGRFETTDGLGLACTASRPLGSLLGVRPERLALLPAGATADNAVAGQVVSLAYLGAVAEAEVQLPSGPRLLARLPAHQAAVLAMGATVTLGWPASASLLLEDAHG